MFSCSQTPDSESKETPPLSSSSEIKVKGSQSPAEILQLIYRHEAELNLCDGQLNREMSPQASSVYALDAQKKTYLGEILCFMGAYQGNYEYIFFTYNGSQSTLTPLFFDSFQAEGEDNFISMTTRSLGGIPNYNQEQKILNLYTKNRGIGDCGSVARYEWQNQGFQLTEYKAKANCDGNIIEPDDYPIIYPKPEATSSLKTETNSTPQSGEIDPITALLNQSESLNICDGYYQDDIIQQYSQTYPLEENQQLVELVCFRTAYQNVYQYFLWQNNQEVQLLTLTQFIQDEAGDIVPIQDNTITGVTEFQNIEQKLSIFSKFAGHGGCGTEGIYQWQDSEFQVIRYSANFDCNNPLSPEEFSVLVNQ